MFVRKRIRKLKNGEISTSYQAVESYRQGDKVKQLVISLGEHPEPRKALKEELVYLKTAERNYNYPLSGWTETRFTLTGTPYRVKLSEKQATKRKEYWRKIYCHCLKRMGKLESVVSKYAIKQAMSDTTNHEKKKEREARANLQEIRKYVGI